MSYKETLYKNALSAIEKIYTDSKYKSDVDLYRSFDIINSINEGQVASKEWLVERLIPFIDPNGKDICVLGGWYGLIALMISEHVSKDVRIDTVDCDPETEKYGRPLLTDKHNINFRVEDAADWFFDRPKRYQILINTSCEHIEQEDLDLMIGAKDKDTIICFQSNNYHSVQSHINTHNSLDEFVDSLQLKEVMHKEKMRAPNGEYDRYMVIGK